MGYSGTIHIVYDGMWGSCGKGKFCGQFARAPKFNINVSVDNNAPNAGHTFIFDSGRKVVTHHLPIGIVNPNIKYLVIGESAVINIDILQDELEKYRDLISGRPIYICDTAAIVLPEHIKKEKLNLTTGSTFTGSGAALISKINREQSIARNNERLLELQSKGLIKIVPSKTFFPSLYAGLNGFSGNENILVECSQGDGLSLNGNSYPYVTSRDCTPAQALKDIHATDYSDRVKKYCVIRPYPIRINNKPNNDRDSYMYTGDFDGAKEIDWETVSKRSGVAYDEIVCVEQSTTTHRLRRVAEFSIKQFQEMILDTHPDAVVLNFAGYIDSKLQGLTKDAAKKIQKKFMDEKNMERNWAIEHLCGYIESMQSTFGINIKYVGTGAKESEYLETKDIGLVTDVRHAVKDMNPLDYADNENIMRL